MKLSLIRLFVLSLSLCGGLCGGLSAAELGGTQPEPFAISPYDTARGAAQPEVAPRVGSNPTTGEQRLNSLTAAQIEQIRNMTPEQVAQLQADNARQATSVANPVPPMITDTGSAPAQPTSAQSLAELALRWNDRSVNLPRLGQALTEGTLAPRAIGPDYRLKAGDQLRIVTWGGTAMNELVPIDATGNVAIPGYGAVPVAGKDLISAQAALTELARSHFKQAGVLIGVELPGAVSVTVAGDVADPGYHSLPSGASVIDALAAAGGVLPQGSLRAIVVREPGQAERRIDLYSIAVDGVVDILQPIAAGSLVFVPLRGPEIQVFGAARRPSAVECLPGDSLAEALRLVGGPSAAADLNVVRVLREGPDGQDLHQYSAAGLADVAATDGDRLLLSRRSDLAQRREVVTVNGSVRSPGAYAWSEGMTVGLALTLVGGTLPDADVAKMLVRRSRETPVGVNVGGGITIPSLNELIGPVAMDTVLEPLDVLVVPGFPPLETTRLSVQVTGAVEIPGLQPFAHGMTVQQALLLAGGLSPDAQVETADLVRVTIDGEGGRQVKRISVDLRKVLAGEPGPTMEPRDELVVRLRNDGRLTVELKGAVRNSGSFAISQGATVGEVLILAGGLTEEAFPAGIRLYRLGEIAAATEYIERLRQQLEAAVAVNQRTLLGGGTGDSSDVKALQITIAQQESEIARLARARATGRLLGIDFPGIAAGRLDADVPLQDGDVIEVPLQPGSLRIFGDVMNPGSLRFEPGLRVQTLIARSGGYTQQADRKRVFVVRADGAVVATAAGKGLAWNGPKRGWVTTTLDSIELEEGDTVIVPPDLEFKPSKLVVAKDITQILFQIAVAAATVVAIAP